MKRSLTGLAAMAAGSLLTLATAQANDPVVVSSKIDTEGSVLGQLILQRLEQGGSRPATACSSAVPASCAVRC